MSEENVELIRSVYDAWDKNESARAFLAEDIEYVNPSYAVEPGVRRGRRSLAAVRDTYEDFRVHADRFLDAGDEVVVLAHYTASGRGSGVPLEGEQGYVWTVRDRQAVRFRWFHSHAEAVAAAGLSERRG
jgi:ketosteroid isomerase-like protein